MLCRYLQTHQKKGGALNSQAHCKGNLIPSSKLHINHLELKAVFLALIEFQDLCSNNIILVATDNTTVVAYNNKEGGMKFGPVCPSVENPDLENQEAGNTQSSTHPRLAECDSRQAIQTRSIHLNIIYTEVFQAICAQWY